MKITTDDVRYIAKLAKLRFSEEEIQRLTGEFGDILAHFQSISNLELENVDLYEFAGDQRAVVRSDINVRFDDKSKLFRNVKSMKGRYVQVPKIIE